MRTLGIDEIPWAKLPENRRRVFLRVDFNVPIKGGKVLDDFRIRQSVPTIQKLLDLKCQVVMGAHLGRPQKQPEKKSQLSLLPIAEHLAQLMDREVIFSEEAIGSGVRKLVLDGRPGQTLILLENLRFNAGEEKNDTDFAERLFEDRDVYINDAFGASHRAHASIHAIAEKAKYKAMGYLLKKEYDVLNQVLHHPEQAQMAVLGGAKIEDKIRVIENLLKTCRCICIGGRMGLAFLAADGIYLGASELPKEAIQIAKRLAADAKHHNVKLLYPVDGRVAESIDATEFQVFSFKGKKALDESLGVFDIGPKTLETWRHELLQAKSIIWNGPMGVFENPSFAQGSLGLVEFLVDQKDKIKTVAGGGETVAAIAQKNALDELFHVSTGGGAMLEFIEGRELPGIEILKLREREIQELQEGLLAS